MIWLAPELQRALSQALGGRPDMARIFNLPGRTYREPDGVNRRTLRFEAGGRGWFLKLHWGVGWGEIAKNLLSLRLPVLGAMHEWQAIRRLEALGVETMALAGCGRTGLSPARLRSFVITEELGEDRIPARGHLQGVVGLRRCRSPCGLRRRLWHPDDRLHLGEHDGRCALSYIEAKLFQSLGETGKCQMSGLTAE